MRRIVMLALGLWAAQATARGMVENSVFSAEQRKALQHEIHQYLVSHPEVLVEASEALQHQKITKAEEKALKALPAHSDTAFFDSKSPVLGNPKGDVSVVVFFDYHCPYCKKMAPVLRQLMTHNESARVVMKELPVFGQDSVFAAKAALAAAEQGQYTAMHDALMEHHGALDKVTVLGIARKLKLDMKQLETDMHAAAIAEEVKTNYELASALHILATPVILVATTPVQGETPQKQSLHATLLQGVATLSDLQAAMTKAET